MLAKNVSIVVATYQRPHFLRRMIGALMNMKFGGHLILSDASTPDNFDATSRILEELAPSYPVKHVSVPKASGSSISLSLNQTIAVGTSLIETDYGMLTCDDDIPVPFTLEVCQQRLDEDRALASAVGDYTILRMDGSTVLHKPFTTTVELYPSTSISPSSACDRYLFYIRNFFHAMFLVTRRDIIKAVVPPVAYTVNYPCFSADYLWMFTLALAGRSSFIDAPHIVRQRHDDNLSAKKPYPTFTEAIMSPTWTYDANAFTGFICGELQRLDSISWEYANEVTLKGFAEIIVGRLNRTLGRDIRDTVHYRSRYAAYNNTSSDERMWYEETVAAILAHDIRV